MSDISILQSCQLKGRYYEIMCELALAIRGTSILLLAVRGMPISTVFTLRFAMVAIHIGAQSLEKKVKSPKLRHIF
jgi:hypothetical protein